MRANARYLSRATERDGVGVVFGKKNNKIISENENITIQRRFNGFKKQYQAKRTY